MQFLQGHHLQESTGRTFKYHVMFAVVGEDEAYFAADVSEPCNGLFGTLERGGTLDGVVPLGPDRVPLELAIRSRVLSHIEATDFGRWKPPPRTWPGWYGPYL